MPTINKGRFCKNSEIYTLSSKRFICREQSETLSTDKSRFGKNSEIDTLSSKRLSVENKAILSQLIRADIVTIATLIHSFQSDNL